MINTNATSFPDAALFAPLVSVSLREEVIVDPSVFDRFVIALSGWKCESFISKSPRSGLLNTHVNQVREIAGSVVYGG